MSKFGTGFGKDKIFREIPSSPSNRRWRLEARKCPHGCSTAEAPIPPLSSPFACSERGRREVTGIPSTHRAPVAVKFVHLHPCEEVCRSHLASRHAPVHANCVTIIPHDRVAHPQQIRDRHLMRTPSNLQWMPDRATGSGQRSTRSSRISGSRRMATLETSGEYPPSTSRLASSSSSFPPLSPSPPKIVITPTIMTARKARKTNVTAAKARA